MLHQSLNLQVSMLHLNVDLNCDWVSLYIVSWKWPFAWRNCDFFIPRLFASSSMWVTKSLEFARWIENRHSKRCHVSRLQSLRQFTKLVLLLAQLIARTQSSFTSLQYYKKVFEKGYSSWNFIYDLIFTLNWGIITRFLIKQVNKCHKLYRWNR